MNNSSTFFFYLARKFITSTIVILLSLILLVAIFDTIEITRSTLKNDIPYIIAIKLSLLQRLYLFKELIPFSIMLGTVFSLAIINKNNEIIAFKALGISPWRICAPLLASSILIGLVDTTVVSKITSLATKEVIKIESTYLNNNKNLTTLAETGIWFQENKNKNKNFKKLIYLKPSDKDIDSFYDIKIYCFDSSFYIDKIVFAEYGKLKNGILKLYNVTEYNQNLVPKQFKNSKISTEISFKEIHKSISEPQLISIIKLPSFIAKLTKLGFSTIKYRLYFYQLICAPLLFCSFSLLGIALSFSIPRSNKINIMLAISLFINFSVYFIFKLITTLALAGKIPVFAAVIIPITIFTSIGAIIIMHFEE